MEPLLLPGCSETTSGGNFTVDGFEAFKYTQKHAGGRG